MNYCSHSLIDYTIETIVISLHDSWYSFQHARPLPVYLPKLQRRHGLGGVRHCDVTQYVNGGNHLRMSFLTSAFYYHFIGG